MLDSADIMKSAWQSKLPRRGAAPCLDAVSSRKAHALESTRLIERISEEARGRPFSKTTSEVCATERARVLAAIGGIDPRNCTTMATPPCSANDIAANASIQAPLCESPKRAAKDEAYQKISALYPPPIPTAEVCDSSPDGSLEEISPLTSDNFFYATKHLCILRNEPQSTDCLKCMNCDQLAHKKIVEPILNTMTPPSSKVISSFLTVADLDIAARARFSKLSEDNKNKSYVCILCDKRIKVLKARGVSPMPPVPPRKQSANKTSNTGSKFPRMLISELQCLAAFQCQVYIFTQCEKISKDDQETRIREQFYGNKTKNIKGACEQIIDGNQAFKSLYEIVDGEGGTERRLKVFCCGGHASMYIPNVDFTVESIAYYSNGKRMQEN